LCWLRSGPSGDEKGINEEMYRMCLQARGYQRVEGGAWVGVRDEAALAVLATLQSFVESLQ
jgi:hypothetical protein